MRRVARFAEVVAGGVLAWAEVVLCAALAGVGGLAYGLAFDGSRWLLPLAGAVVLATVTAVVAEVRSLRAVTATLVTAAAFVIYAVYALFYGKTSWRLPGPAALAAVGDGLVHGWARMLSIGLPADVTGQLLITPVLLVWVASFTAVMLALRTRAVLAPLLPPVVGFVIALGFTASRPQPRLALTVELLLAALLLALLRANRLAATGPARAGRGQGDGQARSPGQGRAALGRIAFGIPVVAAITALGATGMTVLPIARGDHRFDPRELRRPPLEISDALSPLVQVKAQLRARPPVTLFRVRVEAPAGVVVDRVRTAALDSYDGALWSAGDRFVATGRTLPPGQPLKGPVVDVVQQVAVDQLPGPFLPAAGRPVRVAASDFGFDPTSGVLVTSRSQLAGYQYAVKSQVVSRPRLEAALPNPSPALAGLSATPPGLPPELRDLADQLTASQTTPFGQLRAIEAYLRDKFPYDAGARPGHSYGALMRMLLAGTPGDRHGYAEQHAAAFAVLARAKGFPTRVAVGYLLDARNSDGRGTYTVTTANAHAWPEVNFEDYGWVQFEPTDLRHLGAGRPRTNPGAGVLGGTQTRQAPSIVPPQIVSELDPGASEGAAGRLRRARRSVPWLGVGVVAVIGLVVLAKGQRRRRRRRAKTAAGRVVGAWRETTDRLRERGLPVAASLTPSEVADRTRTRFGETAATPVGQMAPIVAAAVFAPFEPDRQAVEQAWELESAVRKALGRQTPALVRLRAVVDPRPLLLLGRRNGAGHGRNGAGPGRRSARTGRERLQ